MATAYPAAADDSATLPDPSAGNFLNSPDHASLHGNANGAIKALEAKLGTGASTPSNNTFLIGNGSGTSAFSSLTSAQMADRVSDETGSGSLVFATTPTLVTPKVDTINENSAANGVTIDGLNIKDNKLNTNDSVVTANITDAAVTPAKLLAGTGTSWPWQSWTPTITNFTLGNGTRTAGYIQMGKTVLGYINITLGGTSSITGVVSFTPPVTATSRNIQTVIGKTHFLDSGTNNYFGFAVQMSTTSFEPRYFAVTGSLIASAQVNTTVPYTWATGDMLNITFEYEAA